MNTDKIYAEKIASEYAPKETSKIVALKKLDALAKRGANVFAYTFGIISTLVFGTECACDWASLVAAFPLSFLALLWAL